MFGERTLSEIFGISNEEIISGELLFGKLKQASITAQFSTSGTSLVVDIVGVYGAKGEGLATTFRALLDSIVAFAKQAGLTEIKLRAVMVANTKLEAKLTKRGFTKTTVTIEGSLYPAYTKTVKVE